MDTKEVLGIFEEIFGEENVQGTIDDTGMTAVVLFPETEVTNERGDSLTLKNLFVWIHVEKDGRIGHMDIRMTTNMRTEALIKAGYVHSHCSARGTVPGEWGTFCLGSGPAGTVKRELEYEASRELWEMFCMELNRCIEVESLDGIPYREIAAVLLENGKGETKKTCGIMSLYYPKRLRKAPMSREAKDFISKEVIPYALASGKLRYCTRKGRIGLMNSYAELAELYSEPARKKKNGKIAAECCVDGIVEGNAVKYFRIGGIDEENKKEQIFREASRHEGECCLVFKGKEYLYTIEKNKETAEAGTELFLLPQCLTYSVYMTLELMNLAMRGKYGDGRNIRIV